MDQWRPINTKRFDGEARDAYERRANRIEEIIKGFRMGRYTGEVGDRMERQLIELQTPALEHSF